MEYENMQYEETIDLKDLCIYILRRWKMLGIAVVIGAVAMGGYKAISTPEPSVNATLVDTNEALIKTNRDKQKANDAEIKGNKDTIEANKRKIELDEMLIENQHTAIGEMEKVAASYEQALRNAQDMLETEPNEESRVSLITQIPNLANNVYNMNARISATNEQIQTYESEIKNLEVTLDNLNERNEVLAEQNLSLDKQNAELKAAMEPQPVQIGIGAIVKYAVLGGFVAAFLICGWIFLRYFLNGRLRSAQELKERYGYYILGDLYYPGDGREGAVEQLLNKWAGYMKKPEDAEYQLIAARIRMASPKVPVRLMVTGTVEASVLNQVCAKLKALLPEKEYEICAKANLTYNAEALTHVRENAVVLVEAADVSDKREVAKLVEVLKISSVNVVGAVVL
ncbi:MAG: hypothetical protein HFI38_10035 [Lachnospiraceae bacterium]|jgi:capsular polysaccharide biosynthesis protein|nr:hypothetical protein [Lachnospiraceae bacterium]